MVGWLNKPSASQFAEAVDLPHNPNLNQLESDIRAFFKENRMSDAMNRSRTNIVNMITEWLKSDGILSQLEPEGISIHCLTTFGSFATHCATKESDLDLCVCASCETEGNLSVTILQAIHRDLRFNKDSRTYFGNHAISEIVFVKTAKVPIVRFKIDGVSVDLSSTFEENPPRSSLAARYINAYCQLDERFAILATFLKMWLKSEGSGNDHMREFPNSYSIILMLIHVLQWYNCYPNLMKSHNQMFNIKYFNDWELVNMDMDFKYPLDENTIVLHRKNRTNNLTVVQLLHLFAFHYSNYDMIGQFRFNMKTGDVELRPMGTRNDHAIEILDTYDKRNPARSVRNAVEFTFSLRALLQYLQNPRPDLYSCILLITKDRYYRHPTFLGQLFPPPKTMTLGFRLPQPGGPQLPQGSHPQPHPHFYQPWPGAEVFVPPPPQFFYNNFQPSVHQMYGQPPPQPVYNFVGNGPPQNAPHRQ